MADAMMDLAELRTTEDAGRSLPSYGPDWDAAIEAGIDVTMLEQNLQLTPAQRIRQLDEANLFLEEVQSRTVPEAARRETYYHRLVEKMSALGPELIEVKAHLRRPKDKIVESGLRAIRDRLHSPA